MWFWLIAITSIISTRFISQKLSNDSITEVVVQASKHDELYQLHKIAKRIKRSKANDVEDLFTNLQAMLARSPFNIWLKVKRSVP